MAINIATLQVNVVANTAQFSSAMKGVQSSAGAGALAAGAAISAGITAPLTALATTIIKTGADFQASMNLMGVVTGATSQELGKMRDLAIQLGADLTLPATSAQDAANAMTVLSKAGLSVNDTMAATKGTLQLAAAAHIDEAAAAQITTDALLAFSLSGEKAGFVADLLANTSVHTKANVSQLGQALQNAGAQFANAKIPIEDLVTSIGLMAAAGIRGEKAGTDLKVMIQRLTSPTKDGAEAMKALGISIFDAHGSILPLQNIIGQFTAKMGGLTDAAKLHEIQTIFGTRANRAAFDVLLKGIPEFDKMKEVVTKTGGAAELAGVQMKGLKGALEGLQSQAETVALAFGLPLQGGLEGAVRWLAEMLPKVATVAVEFAKANPVVSAFGIVLFGITAIAGPALLALGAIVTFIGGPLALAIAAGIIAIAGLATAYAFNLGGLKDAVDGFGKTISLVFSSLNIQLSGSSVSILAILQAIITAFTAMTSTLINIITANVAFISGHWAAGWEALKRIADQGGKQTTQSTANGLSGLPGVWGSKMDEILKLLNAANANFNKAGANAGASYAAGLQGQIQRSGLSGLMQEGLFPKVNSPLTIPMIGAPRAPASTASATASLAGLGGAAKGAKKGLDEANKALRETLQAINEYFAATGNGIHISEEAWLRSGPVIQGNLKALSAEFHRTKLTTQDFFLAMKGGILTTFPGMNEAFLQFIKNAREGADILAEHATPKLLEFIQPFKGFQKDIDAAQKGLDKSVKDIAKATAEAAKEVEKEAKRMHDAMMENFENASQALPKSLNSILDAVLNMSGKAGDALLIFGTKVKEQFGGVLEVLDNLPGAFGNKLKRVTDTVLGFVNKLDSILHGLHKIFNSIPDGLGGMITKIVGLFKGATGGSSSGGGLIGSLLGGLFGGGSGSASATGGLPTGGLSGTDIIGTMTGGGGASGAAGASKGFMSSIGGWMGIAGLAGAALPAIIGLFKGKSQAEKDRERLGIEQMKADLAKTYEDIKAGMIQTMQEGAKLLESLAGFVEVPRKAIKRFINQLGLVLELFLEESKRLAAIGLEQGKAVVDNLGEAFNFLLSGAELINTIKSIATITDANISDFIATTVKIIEKWAAAAATIELQSAKMTGKISDKLRTSFEFLGIVPEVIKGFAESVRLDDSVLDSVFGTIQGIVQRMKVLSEAERGLELNKAGSSAGIFATIFESMKSLVDLSASLSNYKTIEQGILDVVTSDLQRLLSWGDSLISLGESGISKFETLGDVIARMAAAMKGAATGISALAGGTSATSGITASLTRQDGASYLRSGAGGSTTPAPQAPTTIKNYYINVAQGAISLRDFKTIEDLIETVEEIEANFSGTGGFGLAARS